MAATKLLIRLEKMRQRITELEKDLSDSAASQDRAQYQKLAKELAALKPAAESYESYLKLEKEAKDIAQALREKDLDPEIKKLYEEELNSLEAQGHRILEEIEGRLLKDSDPNASRDCILEIRAGTGGEEAALFASDLFRMYSKFASSRGLGLEVISSNPTGKGGFKEIIFSVSGGVPYLLFKYESGIHRVQRVPETEASGRIHTSAVTVAVFAEVDETEVEIDPSDLNIDVFRASGAGGQHVNKTESAVRITHVPTGIVVTCQDERSQHKNKTKALRVLRARLYDEMQQKQLREIARQRKEQVGSGDRSGKIRTYNFPDQRVTDHRIGLTLHSLDDILNGHLDELIQALYKSEKERKLMDGA